MNRVVSNVTLKKCVLRRFSFSNGDLRTVNNVHVNNTNLNTLTDFQSIGRQRSLSFGSQAIYDQQIKNMATQSGTSHLVKTNRLALENSPYLQQHAHNPVDWYPWGQEAFDKAKNENKLIFLSVGYSTCHWCHVMEKESFENDSVAEIMNKHFVNIKVDREERPDVDKMYMSFIQATVGGGGWPMSVFLTPDLQPLAGGTYFPPEDNYGRPGFKTVLKNIAEQWNSKQSAVKTSGKYSIELLKRISEKESSSQTRVEVPSEDCWKKCILQLSRSYDDNFGGFSTAPKFPQPSIFNFLFHMYSKNKNNEQGQRCLEMCLKSLKKIAYGGIHDHVGSGFARYSVDEKWHVPHFEKMLYDQAQLAVSYCDAYLVTKDEFFAEVVRDILKYVSRDLSHDLGGFYGAEDADSYPDEAATHKKEGAFYVWEYDEILDLLDQKVEGVSLDEIACYHFNIKKEGNVKPKQDPHGELLNKNVLICLGSFEDTARQFDLTLEKAKMILDQATSILYEARKKRPKPQTDTKIVTSWNGLMISGFAKAGFALKEQAYTDRAVKAAGFIRKYLYDEKEKELLRCCYKGEGADVIQGSVPIKGFLDDYAFLIRGLLDLYEASLNTDWLQWAEALQEQQDRRFWDNTGSGYFTSPEGDTSILIRGKEDQDGAEPCGNSVSVSNLIRLAVYLDRKDLREKAGRTLTAFSERLKNIPLALPEMTSALMAFHTAPTQVFIAGEKEDNGTQALLDVVRSRFIPGRILAVADGPTGCSGLLYSRHESLNRLHPIRGKPAAYVCRNFACSLPVTEPDELANSLDNQDSVKSE